jgi:hypothetical protein
MGRGSAEGERPVSEGLTCVEAAPEYGGARGILPESSGTIPKG